MADPYSQLPGTMVVDGPQQDPWEQAFQQYRQALVDLDGDGVPDAVVPVSEETAPRGRLASQRPNQQLAPDWRGRLAAGGASLADPFGIPSAVTGIVSPETRDDWRATQSAFPGMAIAGQTISAGGVAGGLMRTGSRALNALIGGGLSAGSDVADQAGGLDAMGRGTAAKALLGGVPALPMRAAIPTAGVGGSLMIPSEANAQPAGVEQRLRGMSPQELAAYQRMIGVNPDGRIGPATLTAATRYETEQSARASQAAETDRIRAQGDADARRESARIEAEARAKLEVERGQSDIRANEAQRPFLQRNPEYSTYAPYAAGALAAAIPAVGALLTRRAATTPQRQMARSVDDAVSQFNRAPTPLSARTLAGAASAEIPGAASPGIANRLMDYGSLGVGAAMPSAAVVAPYFIDYMQPSGSPAREAASQEFTLDKLRERMTGPFAMGLALAGGGRFLGDKAGAAYINPAPRGANMATANAVRGIVDRSGGDDTALTNNLLASLRGGQGTATEAQRLRGINNAQPPNVRFDDMTIPAPPQPRALPPPDPADAAGLPPLGGQGGQPLPSPSGQPTSPPNPAPIPRPDRKTRSALNPSQKLEAQQRFLEGSSIDDLAQQYGVSKATMASIKKNADELVNQSGGDRQRAIERLLDYIKVRNVSYAAAPAVAAGPVNRLLGMYQGEEQSY